MKGDMTGLDACLCRNCTLILNRLCFMLANVVSYFELCEDVCLAA
jgi:hypothetical protein